MLFKTFLVLLYCVGLSVDGSSLSVSLVHIFLPPLPALVLGLLTYLCYTFCSSAYSPSPALPAPMDHYYIQALYSGSGGRQRIGRICLPHFRSRALPCGSLRHPGSCCLPTAFVYCVYSIYFAARAHYRTRRATCHCGSARLSLPCCRLCRGSAACCSCSASPSPGSMPPRTIVVRSILYACHGTRTPLVRATNAAHNLVLQPLYSYRAPCCTCAILLIPALFCALV